MIPKWTANKAIQKKRILYVSVGLIIVAAGFEFFRQPEKKTNDPRYLVFKRNMPEGIPLHFRDLGLSTGIEETPGDAMTDQDLPWLKGAILMKSKKTGEWLCFSDLSLAPEMVGLSSQIPKGFRAYAVNVMSVLPLRRNDSVDIHLSPKSPTEKAMLLVEKVKVLETLGADRPSLRQFPIERQIVVAIPWENVELLEKAKQKGKLSVTLRHPEEILDKSKKKRNSPQHGGSAKGVEIWVH